jgi:hypothetical protein
MTEDVEAADPADHGKEREENDEDGPGQQVVSAPAPADGRASKHDGGRCGARALSRQDSACKKAECL